MMQLKHSLAYPKQTIKVVADNMPSYFKACHTFINEIAEGKTICIGTAYNINDKLKLIADLLLLAGEDKSVLIIEGVDIPDRKQKKVISTETTTSGDEIYYVFGNKRCGNQSQMMYDYFEELSKQYPEKN